MQIHTSYIYLVSTIIIYLLKLKITKYCQKDLIFYVYLKPVEKNIGIKKLPYLFYFSNSKIKNAKK